MDSIEGVVLSPLKVIDNEKGNIFHALRSSDKTFDSFGEAYFSEIFYNNIKGWKKHTKMVMNLVVIVGTVKFVLFDDRKLSQTRSKFLEIEIGDKNYSRLTVPVGIYVAFRGIGKGRNVVLNLASIEHDPFESENLQLDEIKYNWE